MLQDDDDKSIATTLIDAISCREAQIRQLAAIFCSAQLSSSPSTTVVHGVKSTGKSLTISSLFKSCNQKKNNIRHAIVRSADWLDSRELLQAVLSAVVNISKEENMKKNVVDRDTDIDTDNTDGRRRCESISAFVVQLQLLLEGKGKTILVIDGIDRQREPWQTLLPAIARLGEVIANLSVILVVTAPPARLLHLTGVPHVHFPPYSRAESIHIVSSSPLALGNCNISKSEGDWLWTTFCGIVWDSMGKAVARDLVAFRDVCHRLWNPFIQPIVQGDYTPRELHKLIIKNRALFQGDRMIEPEIIPWKSSPFLTNSSPEHRRQALPIFATHLLIAAYLASHTPPRTDCLRFSKFYQSKHKRKTGSKVSKRSSRRHRKIPCHLLGPAAFPAERLYAIYHAILPPNLYSRAVDLNLDEAVAVLWGRRLLVKSVEGDDIVSCKWRIGVGLEFITDVAKDVAFDLDEYLWD